MGERKVLNKYYPPDFDTIRLPKLPGGRPDQYVIRIMAPFTMRCLTCGNYVYKGKKFNSRKEDAKGEKYLGMQIYRFYIRCPECLSEITFKTDPENSDYVAEHGAMRTFQAERLAELEEQREEEEREEEEASNPMLALENRTAESRREMDVLDALEEIRDWNARNASVKHEQLLEGLLTRERREKEDEEEQVSGMVQKVFTEKRNSVRRLQEEEEEAVEEAPPTKQARTEESRPSRGASSRPKKQQQLAGLVVRKRERQSGSDASSVVARETGAAGGMDKRKCDVGEEAEPHREGAEPHREGVSSVRDGTKEPPEGGDDEGKEGDKEAGGVSSLRLLCAYSDSEGESD